MIDAVLLTGTIGAGKTSVAVALGELMDARGLPTAVIDLDWLGWVCGTEIDDDRIHELIVENLRAVVPVFVSRGLERFVLVRGIGDERQVELIRTALGAGRLRTVRLTVPWARIEARLRARDSARCWPGIWRSRSGSPRGRGATSRSRTATVRSSRSPPRSPTGRGGPRPGRAAR